MQTYYYIFKVEMQNNILNVHEEEVGMAFLSAFNYFSFLLQFFHLNLIQKFWYNIAKLV